MGAMGTRSSPWYWLELLNFLQYFLDKPVHCDMVVQQMVNRAYVWQTGVKMSTHLSTETPTARKEHQCGWCGEMVLVGEKYNRWNGIHEGDFQSNAMHSECAVACHDLLSQGWDDEYYPYEHMRGTTCESGCECELHKR